MKRFLSLLLVALLLIQPSFATKLPLTGAGTAAPAVCSQYTAFLARSSALSTQYKNSYSDLICGLVTDGVWSKLDALYMFATQDTTNANLNLVSSSYSIVSHGSPAFTTNVGYLGVDGSSTVYLDTQFNPITASSPKFTQNSAHISTWNAAGTNSTNPINGSAAGGGSNQVGIYPQYVDGNTYSRINQNGSTGIANVDPSGFYIGNRSGASATQIYRNGTSLGSASDTSQASLNGNFFILSYNTNNVGSAGSGYRASAASIGSSLSSGDALALYNRINTFILANPGAEAAAFLARTSGLDTTHRNAYTTLINGLVADGVWAQLDALYMFATQDSTTAALNLISSTYNATVNGSPTFTADRGFTGVETSSTVYINSNFTPSTATSPKYTLNSSHLSVWNLTNSTSAFPAIGVTSAGTNPVSYIYTRLTADNRSYYALNAAANSGPPSTAANYLWTVTRWDPSGLRFWQNGVYFSFDNAGSTSVPAIPIYILAHNSNGTAGGAGLQIAMASIGGSLGSGTSSNELVARMYRRCRTYGTAVGVP
jgi:hypothetical protein